MSCDELNISPDFFQFVSDNAGADPMTLRLSKGSRQAKVDFDLELAITQIECRKSASHKLSETLCCKEFVFPSRLSAEQCTGDVLARWHSMLIGEARTVADLTGGLCIDAFHAANGAENVTVCELNPLTAAAARHNAAALGLENITVNNTDCIEFLNNTTERFDVIFIDPARRAADNARTYALSDCEPDVVKHLSLLCSHCSTLIIKASPMLDITDVRRRLKHITDIYVASVRNECKEVVVRIVPGSDVTPEIHAIDFRADGNASSLDAIETTSDFNFNFAQKDDLTAGAYLYEPMASAMKIGRDAFAAIQREFPVLNKLGRDTHMFVSKELISDFPGRIFQIESELKIKGKEKKALAGKHINIVVRNYVMTAQQLRERLRVKDGGDRFVIGTKAGASDTPTLLLCKRIL